MKPIPNLDKKHKAIEDIILSYYKPKINQALDPDERKKNELRLSEALRVHKAVQQSIKRAEEYGGVDQLIQAVNTRQPSLFDATLS